MDEELPTLYSSARFFLVPSVTSFKERTYQRPELLSIVALESMYSGTPVIGSAVGGLADLLEAAGQVSVRPGDVSAWAEIMSEMASTKETPRPTAQFTWDRAAEECLGLYSEAVRNV
jgi:glycosyltransferase involved in cell wall biosynthesis